MSLFRGGNDDAFRVIHDRYRQRLHSYSRQMLAGSVADAEDVVQEIFVRAYGGLRSSDRELALRAWLYRIAHNRCIDEVRRPRPIATAAIEDLTAAPAPDPMARIEQRDALRRLIADVRRLPEQQRSALLMRELGGMPYADVAQALAVSVPAVKSLLVRARVGLSQAGEARDTSCSRIREDLMVSHDRGVRTSGLARRHMRDCSDCRRFRSEVRGVSRQFAALLPALGPIGVVAKLLGVGGASGGGAAAGTGAMATSGAAAGGAGTGAVASVGAVATGAGHVVTLIAAAVVTAGGAIELQRISPPAVPHVQHRHVAKAAPASNTPRSPVAQAAGSPSASPAAVASSSESATPAAAGDASAQRPQVTASPIASRSSGSSPTPTTTETRRHSLPISEVIDPDNLNSDPAANNPTTTTPSTTTPSTTTPGSPPATGTTTTGAPTTTSPTAPTGTTPTGTSTVPISATVPPSTPTSSTGSTGGSGTTQSPTALSPLTQTSKTSGTNGAKGGLALGATGASTRPGSVRVFKSTHR